MFSKIRNLIQRHQQRHAAWERYEASSRLVGSLLWNHDYSDHKERVRGLRLLAGTAGQMARDGKVIAPRDTDEDGYGLSDRHEFEAGLFLLVLAAEENNFQALEDNYRALSLWIDPTVDGVLADLRDAETVADKGRKLIALCDAVQLWVPAMAVELLAALAHAYLTSGGLSVREAHGLIWPETTTH